MRYYSALRDNIVTRVIDINPSNYQEGRGVFRAQITSKESQNPFYYDFRGTIVPSEWKFITTRKGKNLSRGALELYAIIVSWYNHKKIKDKITGKITFVAKFEGDELKKNYAYFTKELNRSQEQVRRYFAELKSANLVSMELRTIWHKNWRYPNTLCIKLNKAADHFRKDSKAVNIQTTKITAKLSSAELKMNITDLNYSLDKEQRKTTKNSVQNYDILSKKIWTSTHLEVGSTPPKSGVYISNNYLKTNDNKISIDQGISNFANPCFSESNLNLETAKLNQITNSAIKEQKNESEEEKLLTQASQATKASSLQLKKPKEQQARKPLSFFHPLSEIDAIFLRKASNRPFALSFINKLLLKLAEKYPNHGFYKKTLLLSYLTEALKREKHDAEVANNETFYFKPKEGTPQYRKILQSNYLKAIEQSMQIDPITRIKQKIIGLAGGDDEYAYHIITNCTMPYIPGNNPSNNADLNLVIRISSDITQDQIKILTKAAKEVLGQQTNLIFKEKNKQATPDKENTSTGCNANLEIKTTNPEPKTTISSSPLWQKIRNILKNRFGDKGEALDKSWFAKLDIELQAREEATTGSTSTSSNTNKTSDEYNARNQIPSPRNRIKIKCPNSFVRSWIKTNYGSAIEDAIESAAVYEAGQFAEVEYEAA